MDLELAGKVALVSGGSRGIGRAIALKFAREGCLVAICARGEAQLQETIGVLKSAGVQASGSSIDARDGAALRQWVSRQRQSTGWRGYHRAQCQRARGLSNAG